jgi:aldehyde:ferredoxin oxidoreductase
MIDEYYRLHEWDANGIPTPALLERLQISELRPGA